MSDHRTVLAVRKSLTLDGVERQVFVASTASSDRMDDVIDQASWKLDNYRMNPVVLTDHDYRAGNVVGRGEVTIVEGVGLVLDVVKWSSKEYAQAVKLDVEEGIINAVSVGLRPGRRVARRSLPSTDPLYLAEGYGEVYYDCDLLEISIVAVPANAEAVAVRAPLSVAFAKRAVHRGMQMDLASALEFETMLVTTVYGTADKQEGITAFLEKRTAKFTGR